ncbi:MAG: hypothetical protein ACI9MJ_002780, partial [Alphaproteobacteria bacterium]
TMASPPSSVFLIIFLPIDISLAELSHSFLDQAIAGMNFAIAGVGWVWRPVR